MLLAPVGEEPNGRPPLSEIQAKGTGGPKDVVQPSYQYNIL